MGRKNHFDRYSEDVENGKSFAPHNTSCKLLSCIFFDDCDKKQIKGKNKKCINYKTIIDVSS